MSSTADQRSGISRRGVLQGLAVGTAAAGVLPALATPAEAATLPAVPLSRDLTLHLVRRATYGVTWATLAHARSIGRTAWIDEQLNPSALPDTACNAALTRFPALGWSGAQVVANGRAGSWAVMEQVQLGTLLRQVTSNRQLFEMVVEFWADHFAVQVPSEKVWSSANAFDRTVLRSHALGRFSDLLRAAVQSPAVLSFLDNAASHRQDPNENLGRELLELYTVGSAAGYTEDDVRNSARILTGWTFDPSTVTFQFRSDWHDTAPVTVMGFSDSNTDGVGTGLRYLEHLAHHPATAKRIAYKLAVRFVSDDPPSALVDRLAQVYLANDTKIAPVVRALLLSSEFAAAVGAKTRRPGEDAVATIRVLGGRPSTDKSVAAWKGWRWITAEAGHAPRGWPDPNGYPDVASAWNGAAATVGRWNMHQAGVARNYGAGIVYPSLAGLVGTTRPSTVGGFVDALSRRLLFQTMSSADRNAVFTFLGKSATAPVPSYWYDFRIRLVITLILDSPYFALR